MSYVDVGIPLVVGLVLTLRPSTFVKATGLAARDAAKAAKIRKVGFVLLGVAALYLLIRLAPALMSPSRVGGWWTRYPGSIARRTFRIAP